MSNGNDENTKILKIVAYSVITLSLIFLLVNLLGLLFTYPLVTLLIIGLVIVGAYYYVENCDNYLFEKIISKINKFLR